MKTALGEAAACGCMLMFLYSMLMFGYAMLPYEPGVHSESTYKEKANANQ